MQQTSYLSKALINFGTPLLLFAALVILMQSTVIATDIMSLAVTIDLLIVVPLVYFLLIRKSQIPKTTVIPLMVIGLLLGSYFLPKENQYFLTLFKSWALPLIEISILTLVIIRVRKILRNYRKNKNATADFFDALKNSCYEILPKKLVMPFATEIAVFYYGFFHWKSKKLKENEFSYHKNSGTPAILGAFIFIIAIETVAFHLLLVRWNTIAAWVFTGLSIYTALQVFGFARSLSKRPISIFKTGLHLKYGILNETLIPLEDIVDVQKSSKELDKSPLSQKLSPMGAMESHNIIVSLKNENTLTGMYGFKKSFNLIALHVDEPDKFKCSLESLLSEINLS